MDRFDGIEDQDRRVRIYSRQVCIRLSSEQYGELSGAAEIYGVAPGRWAGSSSNGAPGR